MKSPKVGMLTCLLLAGGVLAALMNSGRALAGDAPKRLLVVGVTKAYRHSSIPTGEKVLKELGEKSGAFTVDIADVRPEDPEFKGDDGKPDAGKVNAAIVKVLAEKMSPEALKNYDGVVFENTTGELPLPDKAAFLEWIKAGHAFIGMHAACDTFHGKGDAVSGYVEMLGGEFKEHHPGFYEVECLNQDPEHPATRDWGKSYTVKDEIYLIKNFSREKVHMLLALDKEPKTKEPGFYPVAWCKKYGQGNVFYTSLGHREDVWESETYQKHILGGIKWALGLEKGDAEPQK